MKFNKLPLGLAIAAVMGMATTAYAGSENGGGHHDRGSSVDIDKRVDISQDIDYTGEVKTLGLVLVDSTAMAVSEVEQKAAGNEVWNDFDTDNTASASGNVLEGASGNMGLNIAAGDNNIQQNSVAIAKADSAGTEVDLTIDVGQSYSTRNASDSSSSGGSVHGGGFVVYGGGGASGSTTTETQGQGSRSTSTSGYGYGGGGAAFGLGGSRSSESESSSSGASSDYDLTASVDATLVFGSAIDAETFNSQYSIHNLTVNNGTSNTASLSGNVASDAAGNIGINVASGSGNMQANQLALATGPAVSATATASSNQGSFGNTTKNLAFTDELVTTTRVRLSGDVSGTYEGAVTQDGDTYLDIWAGDISHTGGTPWGHADLDGDEGSDGNGGENTLNFTEQGTIDLGNVVLTGTVTHTEVLYSGHVNAASLSGSVLSGASGNIGVNVAAGTGNLQGNALAITAIRSPRGGNGPE